MAERPFLSIIARNVIGCAGLRHILAESDFDLEASTISSAHLDVSGWRDDPRHVIIIDAASVSQALGVCVQVRQDLPQARIVALCDEFDLASVKRAFALDIDGVLAAEMQPEALAAAIRLIGLGEKAMPSQLLDLLLTEYRPLSALHREHATPAPKLSASEMEILGLIAAGQTNKGIADVVKLSEASVKAQIKAILRKLHVGNRTQAATWAYCHGLRDGAALPNGLV